MLYGHAILVVEDQAIIAMAMAAAIRKANGHVVGPAASAKVALDLIGKNNISAAVLDVTLADGTVAPVVERLVELGVPIVIQSGVGLPSDLASRFPDLIVLIKPTTSVTVVNELAKLISSQIADSVTDRPQQSSGPSVTERNISI